MSFRLFVYWCALCGGWAALAGWGLGRLIAGADPLGSAGIKGLCLGMLVALALGMVDALWVFSLRQIGQVLPRVLACVAIGTVGGLVGGVVGQLLYDWKSLPDLLIFGWTLTGLMVGVSIGAFDLLRSWVWGEDLSGYLRKVLRATLGGTLGGLLGGFLYVKLRAGWAHIFPAQADLWSPSATGFVALGLCIGLWVALAQVLLQEASLKVEAGFRKGRELVLGRPALTIGRAESCDLGLFGDNGIERLHARILRLGERYLIEDASSAGGTYVNEVRISGPTPLRSGDVIRVGKALLRFSCRKQVK